ncbi:hypothetical protein L0222_19750 [bacterium]|nr:hypothetical protein [bacterium]
MKKINQLDFEKSLDLDVIYRDHKCYHEFSSRALDENLPRLSNVEGVYLLHARNGYFDTYIVDEYRRALDLRGFSWGFGGLSQGALKVAFDQIGINADPRKIPTPNSPAGWHVNKDGTLTMVRGFEPVVSVRELVRSAIDRMKRNVADHIRLAGNRRGWWKHDHLVTFLYSQKAPWIARFLR